MPRVDDALSSLVSALLPAVPGEDDEAAAERHEEALTTAQQTLQEYGRQPETYDSERIGDLIKKKLWRESDAPDKAVRFTNLYTRLLTLPILSKKWAILDLLYQLSASEGVTSPRSPPPVPPPVEDREKARSRANQPDVPGARLHQRSRGESERVPEPKRAAAREPQPVSWESTIPVSEAALLRDLPFTLQGLSSSNLPFASPVALSLPSNLPLPIISILHTLAEPSLLYRSLSDFVQSKEEGLAGQSLRAAIGIELRSYLGLIATLEAEIRRAITSASQDADPTAAAKHGVTLKRCVVWTREATMGLRLMALMADESRSKKGGMLISLIHSYATSYGDPFVSAFAERILTHVTRPFYDMLRQWIYDGELSDPYREFFILEKSLENLEHDDPRRVAATSMWEDKYELDADMVPSIITDEFARKIFLIGKSLNFIRYGCGDSAWVEAYSKDAPEELRYGDTATLESSIDKAYTTTMARLIHLMNAKFQLFDHLRALKKYLLLGQGDFVALLIESLATSLDRPAGSQYRHTLTAQLDHAVRGSNAQYEKPEILKRLDARLLELSHGDIGWDVFTLDYKVDAPVDVVVTPWASKQYLVVFNFLWRIKRVEWALGSTWRRCMTGARGVLAGVGRGSGDGSDAGLADDWKAARGTVAEMIHFANQLQYYILFEVVEAAWAELQTAMSRADATLDDLIAAHASYLRTITHKGLLGRGSLTGHRDDSFTSQLHYLLKTMLAYTQAVDGLYSVSVAEFTRAQERAARIETRTAAGQWGRSDSRLDDWDRSRGSTPLPPPLLQTLASEGGGGGGGGGSAGADPPNILARLRQHRRSLEADFRTRLATLLGDLVVQPDPDMKFLGVVMNFNDVYRPTKRKKAPAPAPAPAQAQASAGKEKATTTRDKA